MIISSPVQGDGKTTVATNLARAMARAGKDVILVDADLRRPQVASRFHVHGKAGLGGVLLGSVATGATSVGLYGSYGYGGYGYGGEAASDGVSANGRVAGPRRKRFALQRRRPNRRRASQDAPLVEPRLPESEDRPAQPTRSGGQGGWFS